MNLQLPNDTTINRYLSGTTALNIEDKNHDGGDWHRFYALVGDENDPPNYCMAGENGDINSNHIWGDYGIRDVSEWLNDYYGYVSKKPVYAADYIRAILDMIYIRLVDGKRIPDFQYEDWLLSRSDIQLVLSHAELLKQYPEVNQDLLCQFLEIEKKKHCI